MMVGFAGTFWAPFWPAKNKKKESKLLDERTAGAGLIQRDKMTIRVVNG
jgi:hypothetical protein